ncbi:MAG TPA: AMP-binding protein [Candidatus Dormibacteraeota bacterium]|nr:AMP-binding protein [Candidatus Dormibacteraeota bacterium]
MSDDPLRQVAVRFGPRRALIDRGEGFWVSWFSLDDLAQTWTATFRRRGLQPGERVAVAEPAGVRFAALLFACIRTGAALVPLDPRAPATVIERVLADSRPRLIIRDGEIEDLSDPASGSEGDACVLYTSGTTGIPKGVRLTLDNLLASARGCREQLGSGSDDRWLLCLSPHHVGGLAIFLRAADANQPMITLDSFREEEVLRAVADEHVTLLSVVPTMLSRLLRAGGAEALSGLRAILVGGAPASAEHVREWDRMGLPVCPTYGLTETCSQVATIPPGRAGELAGTAGLVGPHARVELDPAPEFGAGVGEIVVSGPAVSPGYLNPEIRPAPGPEGFHTGDLGRLDDGVLTVIGRRDDGIVTGGESVQPEEVEAVLRRHPAVVDVAVAGRPDPEWGEVVCAWVVTGSPLAESELDSFCREHLTGPKIPRRWTRVEELPRSAGGKLLRRSL